MTYLLVCAIGAAISLLALVMNLTADDMGLSFINLLSLATCMYYGARAAMEITKKRP